MSNTSNYNLFKYEDNNVADLRFINPNFDTIDSELRKNIEELYSIERSNKDSNNIFTTVTYKRPDGTIFKVSLLSGQSSSPKYPTRIVRFYNAQGNSIVKTVNFQQNYDADGNWISETITSIT